MKRKEKRPYKYLPYDSDESYDRMTFEGELRPQNALKVEEHHIDHDQESSTAPSIEKLFTKPKWNRICYHCQTPLPKQADIFTEFSGVTRILHQPNRFPPIKRIFQLQTADNKKKYLVEHAGDCTVQILTKEQILQHYQREYVRFLEERVYSH